MRACASSVAATPRAHARWSRARRVARPARSGRTAANVSDDAPTAATGESVSGAARDVGGSASTSDFSSRPYRTAAQYAAEGDALVARHLVNMKNGIEAVPALRDDLGVDFDFVRIQSTMVARRARRLAPMRDRREDVFRFLVDELKICSAFFFRDCVRVTFYQSAPSYAWGTRFTSNFRCLGDIVVARAATDVLFLQPTGARWRPQSTAAGARGDGKDRQVSCRPSSRWPPGRRGCGTLRRCDRAPLRTRVPSRNPNSPLEVKNRSPRTREGSPRASPTRGRGGPLRGRRRTRRAPRTPVSAS